MTHIYRKIFTFFQNRPCEWAKMRFAFFLIGCSLLAVQALAQPTLLAPRNENFELSSSVYFDWNSAAGSIESRIQIAAATTNFVNATGFTNPIHNQNTSSNTFFTAQLEAGKSYAWAVKGTNSGYSNRRYFIVRHTAPSLNLPDDGATISSDVEFSWNNVDNANEYRLQISTSPNTNAGINDFTNADIYDRNIGNLTRKSFSLTTFRTGVTYYWHARGGNSIAGGIYSETRSFTLVRPVDCSSLSANVAATGDDGTSNGTATATVNGGTAPYTFSWNNGQTTSSISNLSAGQYCVTVTDANNCSSNACGDVSAQITPLSINADLTPATCQANGKAMISVTGGSGSGYQIRWSDGFSGVFERVNLAAGDYSLTVTDANPQVGQEVKTVTIEDQNQVPTVTIQQTIDPMTNVPTELFTSPDNFTTYKWLKDGVEVGTEARLSLENLAAGSYRFKVVVRDNCQQEATAEINVTITVQTLRLEGTAQATAATCPRNGVISIEMTNAPFDVIFNWDDTRTGNPRRGLAAGTYSVTVSAPNYEALILNQIVVADDYTPLAFDIAQRNGTTPNERMFSTNPANLGPIEWRIGSPTSAVLGTDAEFIHEFTVGTHTVWATIMDACNETLTKEMTITIAGNTNDLSVNSSVTPETCRENGNANGTITLQITGGSGQNTIAWEGLTTTSATLTGLLAGTYRYTVTDADPSVSTASGTIAIADERPTPFLQLQSVREIQPRTYTFSVTPTTDLIDFTWKINGTDISTNASFLHTFPTDGNYTINLVTTHRCGKMVEHQTVINVSTSGGGGGTSHSLICRNPEGIPTHTAIFDYQISGNALGILHFGDGQQQVLTAQGTLNHSFQYAGVYYAVLLVNDLPVDTATIIVNTACGWSSFISGIGFTGVAAPPICESVRDGIFHIEASRIAYGYYWTTIHRVQHFGVNGDNASFEVRAKNPQSEGGISCYDLSIAFSGTKNSAYVSLMTDWCSFYANLSAGKTSRSQVAELARDLQAWHTYKLQTENHVVKVFYDGVLIYSMPYEGEIGEIVGIAVNFKGTGSVDKVELKENGAATSAFMDDFSTCQNTQRSLVSVNEAKTICSGQTVIFNQQNLTQTGVYQDTISGMGCADTLKTLNLTVLPAVRTVQNFTIRQGDSIVVNGQVYRTSGIFTNRLQSNGGCDSLVETHLTVIACNLSVQIQKQGNTLRAIIQNAPPQYNVLWTLPNGQTRTSEVIEVSVSGVYKVKITDVYGCEAMAQIEAQREGYTIVGGLLPCGVQSFWLPVISKKYVDDFGGSIVTLQYDSTQLRPTGQTRLTNTTTGCLVTPSVSGNQADFLLYLNRANPVVANVGDTLFLIEMQPTPNFLRQNLSATIAWEISEDHFNGPSEMFSGTTSLRVEGTTIAEFRILTDGVRELTRDNNPPSVFMGETCNNVTERLVADATRKSVKANPMPFYDVKQSVCDVLDRQIETSQDIYLASQIAIASRSFMPTEYQMIAADANQDGKVSAIDISILQQRRIGLLESGFLMPAGTRKTRLYFNKKLMTQRNWHVSRHYPAADTEGGMTRQNVPVIGDDCSKLDSLMRCDTLKIDIVEIRIGDLDGSMSVVLRSFGVLEIIGCDKVIRNDTMFLPVTTPQYATSFDVFANEKTPFIGVYEAENGVMKVKANVTDKLCNVSGYSSASGGTAPKQTLFYVAIRFTGDSTIPQFMTNRAMLNGQPAILKVVNTGCSIAKKATATNLRVYPNPTFDLITLNYSIGFKGQLSLTNAIGRQITTWQTDGSGNMTLNLSEFVAGVYVLKLSDGTLQKIVKQ